MSVTEIKVPVEKLEVGQSIRLPLSWKEHPFLFSRFTIKDRQQIAIIAKLGLGYVFLQGKWSEAEAKRLSAELVQEPPPEPAVEEESAPPPPTEEELTQERARQESIDYHRQVRRCEQAYTRALEQLKVAFGYLAASPDRAFAEASAVVSSLFEQLESHGEQILLLQLAVNQTGKGPHYHGVSVATLSVILGRACGFDTADLRLLAMAALFHDVGKLRIPHSILNKRLALTKAEQSFVDAHPKMAMEMLKGAALGHRRIKQMVANHHEMLDGSGYPQRLKGQQICPLTQVLSVANEYDALVNGSAKALAPHQALAYLFKFKKDQLNMTYLQNLVKVLGFYPPGSFVRLSNDALAKVVGPDGEEQKAPRVILYDPAVPRREARIVSLSEQGIQVQEPLVEGELPAAVRDYLSTNLGGA